MNYQIGIDVVDNYKFLSLSSLAVKRMLTENEYKEYLLIDDSYKPKYLAGRWAAKEAIYKSLHNIVRINVVNIEILYNENRIPYCSNVNDISISISHTDNHTVAISIFKLINKNCIKN